MNTIFSLASKCKALQCNSDARLRCPTHQSCAWLLASWGGRGLASLETWIHTASYRSLLRVWTVQGTIKGIPKRLGLFFWDERKYSSVLICGSKGGVRCEGALTHSAIITWTAGLVTYFRPWQLKLINNCIKITLNSNIKYCIEKHFYFMTRWRAYLTTPHHT